MNAELLVRGLGAQRRGAIAWGLALLLLTLTVLAVWPAVSESGSLDSLTAGMSPDLVAALGLESLSSPAGFLMGNLYALLLPILLAVLGVMHTTALTAGDEDEGRLELLLALPVSRGGVYLSRFASVTIVLALVSVLVGATVVVGGPAFDMDLDVTGVIAITVNLLLFALLHAALALALAGIGLRSGLVLAASLSVLVLGYAIHAFAPMVESLDGLAAVSPWEWALAESPLENGFDGAGIVLLAASVVVLTAIGVLAVRRRTIRTA